MKRKKHLKTSKKIHYIHLVGIFIVLLTWLYTLLTLQLVEFIILNTCIINFIHPKHTCLLTYLENRYRRKAGKDKIKWFRHYILSSKLFRKD